VELDRWNQAGYLGENFMGIAPADANILIYSDQAAMMLEGSWMVNTLLSEGQDLEKYGMFPFPTGTDRLYFFAEMLYVTADSPQKEAAIHFLDYLTSNEVQQQQLGNFGAISINKLVDYGGDQRPLDVEWQGYFAEYTDVYEPADQAFPLAVNTEFWRVQNGVLTEDIDPNEAAAVLQEFIDNYLAGNS
jgi:raffinose/stachyose/melibiose transport system substrate-binding protein